MGDPGATDVVRVMVCCVLVSGVVATPAALMQRAFDQKTKMMIDQSTSLSAPSCRLSWSWPDSAL